MAPFFLCSPLKQRPHARGESGVLEECQCQLIKPYKHPKWRLGRCWKKRKRKVCFPPKKGHDCPPGNSMVLLQRATYKNWVGVQTWLWMWSKRQCSGTSRASLWKGPAEVNTFFHMSDDNWRKGSMWRDFSRREGGIFLGGLDVVKQEIGKRERKEYSCS